MKGVESQVDFSGGEFTVFGGMTSMNHEQVVYCYDRETGLKAIIAIHNTILGPALGGTRMWAYEKESDALTDVLRLSRGMTYKAAVSGLNLGGGKAVIIGDALKDKTDALMRKFGAFVDRLGGAYITAEDVGMHTRDMDIVRSVTPHVTGVSESLGGSGNPSPVTAYGVYHGMKAAAKFKWGSDDLNGRKVLVQGIGAVGETLVKHLTEEGAKVIITDISNQRIEEVSGRYGAQPLDSGNPYSADVDIYAPCALGATLNDETIAQLKCAVVAGAANNQLKDEVKHGEALVQRGIIYAPDFLINAGGLISVYSEIVKYSREETLTKTADIYGHTLEILSQADVNRITPHQAAIESARARIEQARTTQNTLN